MTTTADAAPVAGTPTAQSRTGGIALRRALVLMGFSAILPGSAQLAAGNRTVGRIATRIWLGVIALLVLLVLLAVPFRAAIVSLYANPITLRIVQGLILVLGLGWALLMLDAWRLSNPKVMSVLGKVVSGVLAVVLALTGGSVAWAASGIFGAQASLFGDVFAGGGNSQVQNGRYNVLLLGGDAGKDRTGLRPDSMTVASIDAETGRTVLFSLPRNLQRAPFPADSPLHKLYPNGFYCPDKPLVDLCMLNGIYTLAEQHKDLFPGVKHPGVEATRGVIEEILGLKINYWAMVDMKGFQKLIDAVGGVRIDVNKRVGIGSEHGVKGVYDWIEPGKNKLLDGWHALWFARSRVASSDYERMLRQKCVMNAMLKQLDPATVLTKFQAIADAGKQIVETNLPSDQVGTMLDLAMKGKELPMASVSFTPPTLKAVAGSNFPTVDPDFARIRQTVSDAIAASEAKDQPGSGASAGSVSSGGSTKPSKSTQTNSDNLNSVCKAVS